jgi:hypothetical protein
MRDLQQAVNSAKMVKAMPKLTTRHISPNPKGPIPFNTVQGNLPGPINVLFAFDSDLKGDLEQELKRYLDIDPHTGRPTAIRVLCIVGRGYWFSDNYGNWTKLGVAGKETITFLAGLANTIPQIVASKGKPNFGEYLLSP